MTTSLSYVPHRLLPLRCPLWLQHSARPWHISHRSAQTMSERIDGLLSARLRAPVPWGWCQARLAPDTTDIRVHTGG